MTPLATVHPHPDSLNAFIDGELPAIEHREIQQHLADCHPCTLRVLSATQLKAATAQAGRRFAASPEALARLTAQLQSLPQPQPELVALKKAASTTWATKSASIRLMPSPRTLAWSALAAAIVVAISLLGWHQLVHTNPLAAELLDQHLATLSSASTPQVISTDRHTVKPWFQGRLPFSFNLPESLPPDTTLKGANLAYLGGQPAALLLFTIHKHEVSVFVTQRDNGPNLAKLAKARSGFTIHSATTRDLQIIAVSNVNPAELDNLIAVLVHAQNPT